MALLRTFTVDNIDANSYSNWYKMKVEVHLNSQSIANNTSNITLKQFFATKTSSAGWYTISHTRLKTELSIGGGSYVTRIDQNMRDMPQNSANVWRQFGEWTGNVSHAPDGTRKINVRISVSRDSTTSYLPKNTTGTSSDITLTTIPRYSAITSFTIDSITCTQFRFNYSVDKPVNLVQYSLNGGAWTAQPSGNIITGRTPGTTYTVKIRVRNTASGLYTESVTRSITTYRLTTAGEATFNTGSDLYLTLSRGTTTMVHDVTLQFWHDNQSWVDIATLYNQTASVTFSLTPEQLDIIYNGRVNSGTSSARLKIVNYWGSGGALQGTSYSTTGTVTIVDANPSIESVEYIDIDTAVQAILGNDQKILRNLSALQVIAGKATSQKGATLKDYTVSIGEKDFKTNAGNNLTEETGKIINVGKINQTANQTATLTVTDSRGYKATMQFVVQILNYEAPQFLEASADRLNNYEEPTTLNIEARKAIVKNDNEIDVNDIFIKYRVKENPSGEFGSWINVSTNNTHTTGIWQYFNVSQYMADYPNKKSYTVEIHMEDIFGNENSITTALMEGVALLRFLQDRIESGVPIVDIETGGNYIFFADYEEV